MCYVALIFYTAAKISGGVVECYLIHVYRRDAENPLNITGLAENIGTGEKKAFTSIDELMEMLTLTEKKKRKAKKEVML